MSLLPWEPISTRETLSTGTSIHPPFHRSSTYSLIHPSIHSVTYLSFCPSIHSPFHTFIHLSTNSPIRPSIIHPSISCLCIHPSIQPTNQPSVHPSICLYIHPSIHLLNLIRCSPFYFLLTRSKLMFFSFLSPRFSLTSLKLYMTSKIDVKSVKLQIGIDTTFDPRLGWGERVSGQNSCWPNWFFSSLTHHVLLLIHGKNTQGDNWRKKQQKKVCLGMFDVVPLSGVCFNFRYQALSVRVFAANSWRHARCFPVGREGRLKEATKEEGAAGSGRHSVNVCVSLQREREWNSAPFFSLLSLSLNQTQQHNIQNWFYYSKKTVLSKTNIKTFFGSSN